MEVKVSGVHFDVGDSLSQFCEEKLAELEKYSVNVVSAYVKFSNSKSVGSIKAEMNIRMSGLRVKATATNEDAYAAFTAALEKAEKQVAKYKDRIKKHNSNRREEPAKLAEMPVLEVHSQFIEEGSLSEAPEDIFSDFLPKIEKKEVKQIQTLTVDEAVMQMDLLHLNFFIFQNANTEQLNIVYREADGSNKIGWVEPKVANAE
ncbi:MAG: ribosome-associated translation inhibitor RaiA [Proteobacteria bacterium]|nr:ribosome-associated translation inhibitor RaiA [Pseudomonadota bacterium]